jgi:hypothetical protein
MDTTRRRANAITFKLGGRMGRPESPPGRSEKLIPLVRRTSYDEFKAFNDAPPVTCATSTLKSNDRGVVTVPTGPGLGVEIDPAFVEKHRVVTA